MQRFRVILVICMSVLFSDTATGQVSVYKDPSTGQTVLRDPSTGQSVTLEEHMDIINSIPTCQQSMELFTRADEDCPTSAIKTATPQLREYCIKLLRRYEQEYESLSDSCAAQTKSIVEEILRQKGGSSSEGTSVASVEGCAKRVVEKYNRVSVKNVCDVTIMVSIRGETRCQNWCDFPVPRATTELTPIPASDSTSLRVCEHLKNPYNNPDGTYTCKPPR